MPVIVGVSEGERDFIGVRQVVALVKSLRDEFDFPIFLNADHSYSFERVKEAVDAGFDSVIFDGAQLSFEENIKLTKKCVDYVHSVSSEILLEGELGYIGKSSEVLDAIPTGVELGEKFLTDPSKATEFVSATGWICLRRLSAICTVCFAVADPKLDIKRVKEISAVVKVPLVLHGGSGNSDDDFRVAIAEGVCIVHINTEIRLAYKQGLMLSLSENPDEVAPYKFLKPAVQAVEDVVVKKLKVFNNL